ncbi:MAG: cobalamin-dependent protein [Deltaproteobacteria bacterium]|nr:cobalamin-dependent protein [Deltaproteobacteria bacterium]
MKTLLLHIPQINNGKREIMVIPMGLFSIADYLYKNDIDVRILHYGIQKEIEESFDLNRFIKYNKYKLICLDIHWIKQAKQTIECIKFIKSNSPDIIIVVGGISASYFADELLKTIPEIDFVIRGEGEYPLLRLIKALESNRHSFQNIPNLSYRIEKNIKHNKVTFYTDAKFYEEISHSNFKLLINYDKYFNRLLYADFDTSKRFGIRDSYKNAFFYNPGKGCPYNCIYCGSHFYKKSYIKQKKGFYFFSLKKAISDICNSYSYRIDVLRISFDPDPERRYYIRLFNELPNSLKKKIRLIFDCFTLPSEAFVKSVTSHFRDDSTLIISMETGSDYVRGKINRPYFTNHELIQSLKKILKYPLNIHIFLSFGLPFERSEDFKKTLEILNTITRLKNIGITICPIIVDIGSQMYEFPSKYNVSILYNKFSNWALEEISDDRTYYKTTFLSEVDILNSIKSLRNSYE